MDKKLFIFVFIVLMMPLHALGQIGREPGNNIGKTLSVMKQKFPGLRYIKTESKGIEYEDGYPENGIATFFYFKNNKVVEECMIVQATDEFPKMWYDKMVDSFISNYTSGFGTDSPNAHHWCYSTFQVHLIYISEGEKHTALIVYEQGGYNTGVTGKDFFNLYSSK